MDNSVVLCTVSYTNIVILWYVSTGATVFPHFSVGLVSVFLHFTEIYLNETKISLAYNFQKSPFFVVLLLKIAVFRNDFGKIRPVRTVYDALLFIRHLVNDALLYLTHLIFDAYSIFCAICLYV